MLAQYAFAWLLTYLLHSTLLLSLAWLASKPLARWSVAAEEAVWKLALIGALLTASLQLAAGWEPAAGRWRLAQTAQPAPAAVEALAIPASREVAPPARPFRFAPPVLPAAAPAAVPAAEAPTALSFHPGYGPAIVGPGCRRAPGSLRPLVPEDLSPAAHPAAGGGGRRAHPAPR